MSCSQGPFTGRYVRDIKRIWGHKRHYILTQVRTICTEHHADICLGKEAKKWASAYMKECRTLRDANKELNRLLGQIAKGEKVRWIAPAVNK